MRAKLLLVVVGVCSLVAVRMISGPEGPKLAPDLRRPAEANEVRLPLSMWTAESTEGHLQFSAIRRVNYNSVGPEDDWSEVIDVTGQIWQIHGGNRRAVGRIVVQRIDISGDGIDEWVLSAGDGSSKWFAVLQTTDPPDDLAVVNGPGEFQFEDGVAEMLGGRWIPGTDKRGLLRFRPDRPELQCVDLEDC
jgi:hypothetical protein